ncbi:glycosyltransferase family 9 protein [Pectinatus sottacetonis]|uniref:glycosyltransferase family 9 protein n=1 Tax=Pectinatus sottacetonis TaxID=1002795 RepID=UPI0018C6FE93|nr:glycosyltransferase family 9 protein [Pectinatus sottacetonis]
MQKILIINRLGIGDVVLTTPLAQLIKENIQDAVVGFLTADKAVDLLQNHKYIDDVFSYKHRQAKKNIIAGIKEKGYTDAIIVDGRLSSTLLAWKAGCHLLNKGYCISVNRHHFFPRKETATRAIEDFSLYASSLLNIDFAKDKLTPRIGACSSERQKQITAWIKKTRHITKKIVLIVPRTAADIKNWNIKELGKLNEYLNTQGIKPLYIGSPHDTKYIESICGDKINLAGKLSLRDIPEVAQYASWALSMCTGPLHILSTVAKLPIIALYGPSDPRRWAPKSALVIQSNLPCVPCLKWDKCPKPVGNRCMDNIKFTQVKDLLLKNELL